MADAGSIGRSIRGVFGSQIKAPASPTFTGVGEPVPNKGTKTVSGTVKVSGVVTQGLSIRAYAKSTGELVGWATSASDGTYTIHTGYFDEVYVLAFDPTTYQMLGYDQVAPG